MDQGGSGSPVWGCPCGTGACDLGVWRDSCLPPLPNCPCQPHREDLRFQKTGQRWACGVTWKCQRGSAWGAGGRLGRPCTPAPGRRAEGGARGSAGQRPRLRGGTAQGPGLVREGEHAPSGEGGRAIRVRPSALSGALPTRRDRAGAAGAAGSRRPERHPGDLHLRQWHPLPQRQDQPVLAGRRGAPAGVVPRAPEPLGPGQRGLREPPRYGLRLTGRGGRRVQECGPPGPGCLPPLADAVPPGGSERGSELPEATQRASAQLGF